MSEEKKGFRSAKKPTKAEVQKEQAQQFLNQIQLLTNVNMQMANEIRRMNSEISAMANLLRLNADVSKVVEQGDSVMLDHFGRFINEDGTLGDTFEGGFGTGYVVESVGSGLILKEIEESLIGKHPLDTFDMEITFPDSYKDKSFVGKKAKFSLRVCNVWKKSKEDLRILDLKKEYDKEKQKVVETKNTEENTNVENKA